MRTSHILAAALAAATLAGCAPTRIGPAPAGLHTRVATAITYYLDKAAGDALELGVRESFQMWSEATMFKFSYGGRVSARIARDGRDEVVIMRHWPQELPIGDAAWCQVYLDAAGKIREADILLNAQAFSFTTRREAKPGSLFIEDVLEKEIGRSIGLGLKTDVSAIDDYRPAQPGEAFEPGIDPADMAAYLSLYATDPKS
jgi:hypothetical protein